MVVCKPRKKERKKEIPLCLPCLVFAVHGWKEMAVRLVFHFSTAPRGEWELAPESFACSNLYVSVQVNYFYLLFREVSVGATTHSAHATWTVRRFASVSD